MDEASHVVDGRRYVDPDVLDRERRSVFDRAWLFVGNASEVRRQGATLSVAWRDHHRVLVERLDSRLVARGPVDLRVAQWRGQIWVTARPDAPSLSDYLGPVADDLAPYALADFEPIRSRSYELPCNWKAPLDISLESYHLETVHGSTIDRIVGAKGQRCAAWGDHQQMVVDVADYAWRRWLDTRTNRGGPYDDSKQHAFHRYFLFPNTILNVVPSQMTIYTSWPIDTDRCRLEYRFCARPGAGALEWARTRLTAWVSSAVLREDLPILRRFQQGVGGLGGASCRLHDCELTVARFHQALDRWTETELASPSGHVVTGAG